MAPDPIREPEPPREVPRGVDPAEQAVPQVIEQLLAAFFRGEAPADPISQKLTREHLTKIIEQNAKDSQQSHERYLRVAKYSAILLATIPATILLLCLMFLAYGKSEQVDKIIALVAGLIGGFGIRSMLPLKDPKGPA